MGRFNNATNGNYLEFQGTPPGNAVPLSIGTWFKVADVTNYYALASVHKFANAGTDDYFSIGAAGATAGDPVFAEVANSAAYNGASSATGYVANQWAFALGVFESATMRKASCNLGAFGTETTSRTPVAASIDRTQLLNFVSQSGTFSPCNGVMAYTAFWNGALSAGERDLLVARRLVPWKVRPEWLQTVYCTVNDNGVFRVKNVNPWRNRGSFDLTVNGTVPVKDTPWLFDPSGPAARQWVWGLGNLAAASGQGSGTSTGVAVGTGIGRSKVEASGTSAGVAAGDGIARSKIDALGTSAGVAVGTGIGQSKVEAFGTSAGVGAGTGAAQSKVEASGTSAGVGAGTGSAQSTVKGVGTSAGVGAGTGVAQSKVEAFGASAGVAAGTGIGPTNAAGSGTAAGTSTATGVAQSKVEASGTSAGTSTASGAGRDGNAAGDGFPHMLLLLGSN